MGRCCVYSRVEYRSSALNATLRARGRNSAMALLCSECPNETKPGTRGKTRVTCSKLCAKNRKSRLLREQRKAKRKGNP